MIIRKKTGAMEKVVGTGGTRGSGPLGMTDVMKERAIEGLAGCTGKIDAEE
jgi:hypothetical protein